MEMLTEGLKSEYVQVLPLDEDDMKKYGNFLSLFYRRLPKVENMHIFCCGIVNVTDKKLEMVIL
jgi:hypothetical protein